MSNAEGENGRRPELGTIQSVDFRDVWPNEAAEFTPWLAENVSVLGEALGMELEVDTQEASVGSYSLGIRAYDLGNGRQVIIESQLEDADHMHLGQLLIHAAGFDANVIVWIARNFQGEHQDALALLNRRTGEDTEFFGVEVELWRIDNSRPAVNFNLVATPLTWRREAARNERQPSDVMEQFDTARPAVNANPIATATARRQETARNERRPSNVAEQLDTARPAVNANPIATATAWRQETARNERRPSDVTEQLDTARPAVNANPIATATARRQETARNERRPSNVAEQAVRRQEFYQKLIDTLREGHRFTNERKAQSENYQFFPSAYGQGVWYATTFSNGGMARVELYIDNDDKNWNKALFDWLRERRADIEAGLGENLEWERLDANRPSRIAAGRPGSLDDDEETLAEIRAWMVQRLLMFKQVFGSRLDELTG